MENIDNKKMTYTKNLTRQNFNLFINIPVDSNVNIKTILNINSYMYDKKIETANNKAIVSGKIGIKITYVDTDNIFNTLTDSQTFTETIADTSITSDSILLLTNENLACEIISYDGLLKLNCTISFTPIIYINIPIPAIDQSCDNMITKKCTVETTSLSDLIDSNFEYTCNLETNDNISKILSYNAYIIPDESIACDNSIIVSGNIYSTLLYETEIDGVTTLKEITATNIIKCDFAVKNLSSSQLLDLIYSIDQSKTEISSDVDDKNSIITITHTINVCGVSTQNITLELIDDMYSLSNELALNFSEREFNNGIHSDREEDYINGEIFINDNDSAIDNIISNSNINIEVANCYLKDNHIVIEGITTSQLIYIDENQDLKSKNTEIPFVIETKVNKDSFDHKKVSIFPISCKTKVKRGTTVEFEYGVMIAIYTYPSNKTRFVDNFTIGKTLDFSKYDYQVYLTRQNETLWELSKRICIRPEELISYNKNLPSIMTGTEKVIIKR